LPKIDKEWVDAYFQYGVDMTNRRVFVNDIDEEKIQQIVRGLYLMDTESEEDPCEMFISSYGGSVYDCFALYDIMKTVKCPIHTFVYGKCMSAAPLLLVAGEKGERWVSENCVFMHHSASDELSGRVPSLVADVKQAEKLEKKWNSLMAKHTNKDAKFWERYAKKGTDFYFGAEEALEWGLADSIWDEKQND
jgi:ATP-dependent Clp protease protease subunit